MKCYMAFAYFDLDRDIGSYTVFIPTPTGMKVEGIDIHGSWDEEEDTKTDYEKVKEVLSRKYKTKISLVELKPAYHAVY